jgi:hypothetical protein
MKKNVLTLVAVVFSCLLSVDVNAQIYKGFNAREKMQNASILRYTDKSTLPDYIEFSQDKAVSNLATHSSYIVNILGLDAKNYSFKLRTMDRDNIGFSDQGLKTDWFSFVLLAVFICHVGIISQNLTAERV